MELSLNETIDWFGQARRAGFRASKLAAQLEISTETLRKFFHRVHGMAPSAALRRWRMQKAYELLAKGHSPKATAIDLGYKHLSNFSRDFKNYFGIPPSAATSARSPAPQMSFHE